MSSRAYNRRTREEQDRVINELAAAFPALFVAEMWEPHKPIMRKIRDGIIAATGIEDKAVSQALRSYTGRLEYLKALTQGGPRFDLQGNACDELKPDEVEHAKELLAAALVKRKSQAEKVRTKARANAEKRAAAVKPPQPAAHEPASASPAEPKKDGLAALRAAARARKVA
jgi:sRNA-binding protein